MIHCQPFLKEVINHMTRSVTIFVASVVMLSAFSPPISAQSGRAKQKEKQEKDTSQIPPVSIVSNPSPQYFSGEVSVTVRGNENPIIRLGLAQNGVALVEFPASDRFFAINPGNPGLVTIEDSPTKETDRFFVIRPGTGFTPAPEGSKAITPATSIIVQMSSGMTVTFLLYPVRDIEQNAHRCVVMYDRDAIVSARKAAGLATNLDQRDGAPSTRQRITSIRMAPDSDTPSQKQSADHQSQPQPENPLKKPLPERKDQPLTSGDENGSKSEKAAESQDLCLEDFFPKGIEKWSKTQHGVKIAVHPLAIFAKQRQVAVAVRNTLDVPIKIVAGHPELRIHTLDKKGRVLQAEPITLLKTSSSAPDGMIAPKETACFLLTYEAPVLGAKQRLGVAVAQTNAADEPVMVELTTGER